jgi:lipopolysaccharide/colanic/teichoic acid biosynthesis glycosyltransferase
LELIGAIALAVLAIVGAATSRQLADEFKAWSPWIVRKIIRCAVRQLPEDQRERFSEEWQAHVNDIPGDAGKLIVALGFLAASREISSGSARDRRFALNKRAFDIIFSVIGLAIVMPLMILIGVAIKLDSSGPIFVRHTRAGYNNKSIRMLRFRSTASGDGDASTQALYGGPRVTRVGRILRRGNFDELPQLFNVLFGQMSMVGPRPLPIEVNRLFQQQIPTLSRRRNAKPGITGWAQVNGSRGEISTLEKMQRRFERDVFYVDNRSLLLDLKIILMTLFSKGAWVNEE